MVTSSDIRSTSFNRVSAGKRGLGASTSFQETGRAKRSGFATICAYSANRG